MIIDRDLRNYLIHEDASMQEAAQKVTAKRRQIVFCVDSSGRLVGSVSNGDLIRWVAIGPSPDVSASVGGQANRSVRMAAIGDWDTVHRLLRDVLYVPLIDDERRVVGVARNRQAGEGISLADRVISDESPAFVIAEIGNNHNGAIDRAFDLIRAAAGAGADCAKFQMRNMKSLYGAQKLGQSEDLGTEYVLDQLQRFQLTDDELFRCFDFTHNLGMIPLCTAWDQSSAEKCHSYGLQAFKTASADLTNHELLNHIASLNVPLICSTGMSTEEEIQETVRLFNSNGSQYILLHCNSTYPAPFRDVNLRYLSRLREISGGVVGYSGHERDIFVSVSAVSLGARVVEKHFTFDRTLEGNDHKVSLLPEEFRRMVIGIRQVEESLGSDQPRVLTQGEKTNRITLGKSLFAAKDIQVGEVIEPDSIEVRSPGQGLQPNRMQHLIGRKAHRKIDGGTPFYPSDLAKMELQALGADYGFSRPWGIPVRHRDVGKLIQSFQPDLVEFHLSYRDMALLDSETFLQRYDCSLVVHAPELFEGEHIVDLASPDNEYRKRSLFEMAKVITKAKSLASYFRMTEPVGIVCNVGGFSTNRFLSPAECASRERQLLESLQTLADPDVQLWPQTMPPYPWHFGGQSFHNLFVSAESIVRCCKSMSLRVCLDVSHSRLACTENGWSFNEFLREVGPLTAHMHIADAKGVDGEGLQVGEGELDFPAMFSVLDEVAPQASFIPEIWQGHENTGEGFKVALQRLAMLRSGATSRAR